MTHSLTALHALTDFTDVSLVSVELWIPNGDLTDMILAIGDTYRDDFRSVRKVGRHVDACSDATCQPNLLLMQVAPPVDQICN